MPGTTCGCRKEWKEHLQVSYLYTSGMTLIFLYIAASCNAVTSTKLAKFLFIPPVLGEKKKSNEKPVNSGARVLPSQECVQMLEMKKREKKEAVELKKKRKMI